MTNYNDGDWHGWNGGECPVHRNSRIEWMRSVKFGSADAHAGECPAHVANWDKLNAFRVIKEYREPREFWVYRGLAFSTEDNAMRQYLEDTSHDHTLRGKGNPIHVREVLE